MSDFDKLCESLDELDALTRPFNIFDEAVRDPSVEANNHKSSVIKNTMDTTRDVMHGYNQTINTGGTIIKAGWDAMVKIINVAFKTLQALINTAIKLPTNIINLTKELAGIPSDVKNKIKGNIKLYITIDDIAMLYNNSLLQRLDTSISTIGLLTRGEMWKTMFNRDLVNELKARPTIPPNDMKLCRKLEGEIKAIQNIQFSETLIDMGDPNNIDIYFGNKKCIEFTDLTGRHHNDTYYEALLQLMKDIQSKNNVIQQLQTDFGSKLKKTQDNQTFAQLSGMAQQRVYTTMNEISQVATCVGNIVRYVQTDVNTMENATRKLNSYMNRHTKLSGRVKK